MNMVDSQLALLREWGEGVDRICREVWKVQGEAFTPEFVRDVLVPEAMSLIEARKGAVMSNIELTALRTRDTDRQPAQSHLVMEINSLKSEVGTKYEIEARTVEHKIAAKQKPTLPEPIRPVNTALTKTFPPPTELSGKGIIGHGHSAPKPTQVPHDPPMYFPSDLWPQTNVILLEAQREFPHQTQTRELCRHVVAKMTPIFCEAVSVGKIEAGSVLCEGGGGMGDLLHSLLVYNDDKPHSGFSSLSDEAYHLGNEIKQSDEWLALAKAILETQCNGAGADRLARAQNSEKTVKDFERKPTNAAGGPACWPEVEIVFVSDERVQIFCNGNSRETLNYSEFGFADGRNEKPNRAWVMLREMAKKGGTIPRPAQGKDRAMTQKRIEEIREKLRSRFGIQDDPIPFNGQTYQTSFKIRCTQSFDT